MSCPAFAPASGFVSSLLNYIDCQAQAIGAGGYEALAAPGSTLSLLLTGFLTLFVALFGYRMLLGETPSLRDGVLALVKVGIVLALATSWAAYRTLVYDVALNAPAQLASDVGRPAALPGTGGGLVPRIDYVDSLFVALAEAGVGTGPAAAATPQRPYLSPGPATGVPPPQAQDAPQTSAGGFDSSALGWARVLFLAAAAGALAALRIVAGVLLALGPFFFAFLLFDATRGLFEGWLRVLAGTALGALGVALALGVEIAFIEPRLAYLLSLRAAGYAIPGAAIELLVIVLVFAAALLAVLIGAARIAYGFRFPAIWRGAPGQIVEALRGGSAMAPGLAGGIPPAADRSRAAAIVDAVAATQRRETGATRRVAGEVGGYGGSRAVAPHPASSPEAAAPPPLPLGQSHRRTRNRASASAGRRDRGA
jgi:type IV secretion system protein VirB6